MPKPNRQSAQQQGSNPETVFSVSIAIPNKYLPIIEATPIGGIEPSDPVSAKIAAIAEGAMLDLCEGGKILQPPVMRKLAESFGQTPEIEDVVDQFQKGVGRKDGKLQITISLDPAYESVAQQAADFQGVSIQACLQNCWDTAWDNGDFYDPRPHADRVAMANTDKQELVKLLGKDFSTGTELAGLLKQFVSDHEGLFSEVADK